LRSADTKDKKTRFPPVYTS